MANEWMALLEEPPLQEVRYRNRRALPPLVVRRTSRVDLFVPSPPAARIWSHVRLRVSFGDTGKNFYVGGRVVPGRSLAAGEEGYFLAIEEPADLRSFEHLWNHAIGVHEERATRWPASIRCSVRAGNAAMKGRILDVSTSGAFVATSGGAVPQAGAAVELRVRGGLLRLQPRQLRAHLVWRGQKAGLQGFGAEFDEGTLAEAMELLRTQVAQPVT